MHFIGVILSIEGRQERGDRPMTSDRGADIIEKAKELGADMVGIAGIEALKKSPSHKILDMKTGLEIKDFSGIDWPEDARSVIIIAVSHPEDQPELDWWDTNTSQGNSVLIRIGRELSEWIREEFGINTYHTPYSIERGGIYMKDAAVLSGLGCIGRNNILITPEMGPRVRLRAVLLSEKLPPTGPISFDPCEGCEEFCRKACPQNAFAEKILSPSDTGMTELPGRDGSFSRDRCMIQMTADVEKTSINFDKAVQFTPDTEDLSDGSEYIHYCRLCEFACPVGK